MGNLAIINGNPVATSIFTTSHSGNAYSVSITGISAYTDLAGIPITIKFDAASTGAITINVNALGALSLVDYKEADITDVVENSMLTIYYNPTTVNFMSAAKGGDINLTGDAAVTDVIAGKTFYSDSVTKQTGTLALTAFDGIACLRSSIGLGGNISSIVTDDDYIYCASGNYIKKISKLTFEVVATSPSYGGAINALAISENYIYAGGDTTQTIRKYNLSDLSYVAESPKYVGLIISLAIFGDYIYAGGMTTNTIRKYALSDLSYVAESPSYGGAISALAISENYIYAGGDTTQTIRKYNLSDLSYVAESPNYGGLIISLAIFGDYIYAGGITTSTIRKYNLSDLSYVAESPSYVGNIYSLSIFGSFIYANIYQTIRKFALSDLSYVAESPSYVGNIRGLAISENYIYVGGTINNILNQYSDKIYIGG